MSAVIYYKPTWCDWLNIKIEWYNKKIEIITKLTFLEEKVDYIFRWKIQDRPAFSNENRTLMNKIKQEAPKVRKDFSYSLMGSNAENLYKLVSEEGSELLFKYYNQITPASKDGFIKEFNKVYHHIIKESRRTGPDEIMLRGLYLAGGLGVSALLYAVCPPVAVAHRFWRMGAYVAGVPTDPLVGIPNALTAGSAPIVTADLRGQTPHFERAMSIPTTLPPWLEPHLHVAIPEYKENDPMNRYTNRDFRDFGGAASEGADFGVSSPDISLEPERI